MFYAPFFTTWFCSMGTLFIFPIYLIGMLLTGAKSSKIQASFKDGIQGFRNKGITIGETRICNYLPTYSTLDIFFCQIQSFIRFCLAFVFGLQSPDPIIYKFY